MLHASTVKSASFNELRAWCVVRGAPLFAGLIVATAGFGAMSSTVAAYGHADAGPLRADSEPAGIRSLAAINPTPGCGTVKVKQGVFSLTTTDGAGRPRTFLMQVPAVYNPNNGYSLNFVFHGAGGSSSQSYSWGLQSVTGASESGIFVFPDGIAYQNYGIGWDDTTLGYDMVFFDNMVKAIGAGYCVNTARIFAAGFSWGGDFVTALACNRGNVIRAVAINSATDEFGDNTNYLTYADLPCANLAHPAARYVHANGGDAVYPAPDFATTSLLLRSFNACASSSKASTSSTPVMTCVSYNSCTKEMIECSFDASIGHAIPPNWAADTWAFIQTFR